MVIRTPDLFYGSMGRQEREYLSRPSQNPVHPDGLSRGRTECAHDKPWIQMVLWATIWSPLPVYVRIKPGFETACSVRP